MVPDSMVGRLKAALTGSRETRMVLVGNFEVESQWALGETGLPRIAMVDSRAIVDRMDEFALLLADPQDVVVLGARPDDGYLGHLHDLGLDLPTVLTLAGPDPARTITENALRDPIVQPALAALAADGACLWPHGVSRAEEELARSTGLRLAAEAAVCKRVNSKIYSRTVADELGLRQPAGFPCRNLDELAHACGRAAGWLDAGRPIVVKDAFGVSGKGIQVVRERRALDQLQRMVARQADRTGRRDIALVVEEWVPKRLDLNYQFTLAADGTVGFDFVQEAITRDGVHKGHRIPARIPAAREAELRSASAAIGRRLATDGYFGVVGVDAMLDPDERLYPVVEINARNNMSTYQQRLYERFVGPGQVALATHYPLRLRRRLEFDRLRQSLGDLLLRPDHSTGLLVNNFATVNAAAGGTRTTFESRLYGIVVAGDGPALEALDRAVRDRLATLEEGALVV